MKGLSLKMKLGLGFGALIIFMAVLGVIAYSSTGQLAEIADRVRGNADKKELADGHRDRYRKADNWHSRIPSGREGRRVATR